MRKSAGKRAGTGNMKRLIPAGKKTLHSMGLVSFDPEGMFCFETNRWLMVYEAPKEMSGTLAGISPKLCGRLRITMHWGDLGGRETCHLSLMENAEDPAEAESLFAEDEAVLLSMCVIRRMSVDEVMTDVALLSASIFLGMAVALAGIQFPTIIDKTINSVAQLATPLALIVIGAGFEGKKALAKIKPTAWAAAIKLVIQPLIFLPVAAYMGFHGEKMIAILIMLSSPTTPSCFIMAKNMKNDGVLTASVIVTTTLLSAFTLTFWIFLLRRFGLI